MMDAAYSNNPEFLELREKLMANMRERWKLVEELYAKFPLDQNTAWTQHEVNGDPYRVDITPSPGYY